jgi:hypothetical protein
MLLWALGLMADAQMWMFDVEVDICGWTYTKHHPPTLEKAKPDVPSKPATTVSTPMTAAAATTTTTRTISVFGPSVYAPLPNDLRVIPSTYINYPPIPPVAGFQQVIPDAQHTSAPTSALISAPNLAPTPIRPHPQGLSIIIPPTNPHRDTPNPTSTQRGSV